MFNEAARSELPMMARNEDVEVLILFGSSDHVLYPDFDRMAAAVFPNHVGPFLLRDCGHFVPWEAPDNWSAASGPSAETWFRRRVPSWRR